MSQRRFIPEPGRPQVVGSIGSAAALALTTRADALNASDLVEIRLDSLAADGLTTGHGLWAHLAGAPLLFTARRREEGGMTDATAGERMAWLESALPDAALLDVELASVAEMRALLRAAETAGVPWLASFHDFERLPETRVLEEAARRAAGEGAALFKVAARLHTPEDLARLASFQLADHGVPVSGMGMGPLGAVSRLLCAQCGSVLNYGYLGDTPTAPGQWHAALLREMIGRVTGA